MISEIRDYFRIKIEDEVPTYSEFKELFSQDYSNARINTLYHIIIGDMSEDKLDIIYDNDLIVKVVLAGKGFKDPQGAFDSIMDKALNIRDNILSPLNLETECFNSIISSGITVEPLLTNENGFFITMTFNVKIFMD